VAVVLAQVEPDGQWWDAPSGSLPRRRQCASLRHGRSFLSAPQRVRLLRPQ
jgi:hypothetical protein